MLSLQQFILILPLHWIKNKFMLHNSLFDELLEDSWLENIKNSDAFRLFLDQLDHSYKTRRSAS